MPRLLVQCNICQVDIRKVVRICVWIDLGGEAPVIDLSEVETAPPANVCPDLATEPLETKRDNYLPLGIL